MHHQMAIDMVEVIANTEDEEVIEFAREYYLTAETGDGRDAEVSDGEDMHIKR